MFNNKKGDPLVVRYVDSYYYDDMNDKRSTTEHVFTLVWRPIC